MFLADLSDSWKFWLLLWTVNLVCMFCGPWPVLSCIACIASGLMAAYLATQPKEDVSDE